MVNKSGVRLFQRSGRGAGDFPYTEEELSLNVRRALEEFRQDLSDRQPPKAITLPSNPFAVAGNGEEMVPPPRKILTPGSNRYVVNCVNGVVRVMAIPTSPVEDTLKAVERNPGPGAVVDVASNSAEINKSKSPAKIPSCSGKQISCTSLASSSSRRTGSSTTTSCARRWDPNAQPLMFSPDASCSSAGSEILDLNGRGTESVASWTLSPRDDYIPHPRFFFKDGTLELLVENSLYKVHRHFFEHYSSLFPAIFTCLRPASSASTSVAIRPPTPIHLPDMTTIDFDRLLSILYPTSYAQRDISSTEEWISVMDISSKLEFPSIYELSVSNITPRASVLDKAVLGRRYGVKSWVVDAYSELCTREKPLTLDEGKKLGIDLVIKINELRHDLFFGNGAGTDPRATSSMSSLNFFEELPERIVQHFGLHTMDEGLPEGDGKYFKAVIDANR